VLCLTWLFSGWLSMKPFDMFSGKKLSEQESRHWAGKPPYGPLPALPAQIGATEKIGEIEWIYFAGRPILLGLAQHRTWMLDAASGAPLAPFAAAAFTAQAAGMLPHAGIKAATWLEHGDRYYYGKRLEAASPVIRIDLDDMSATSYYIDPATTRIVASQDNNSRTYRWLFAALHRLDFAPFDNAEIPRWIVVILFSIGGVILTAAGMVMQLPATNGGLPEPGLRMAPLPTPLDATQAWKPTRVLRGVAVFTSTSRCSSVKAKAPRSESNWP
jgi:hypothetical protein